MHGVEHANDDSEKPADLGHPRLHERCRCMPIEDGKSLVHLTPRMRWEGGRSGYGSHVPARPCGEKWGQVVPSVPRAEGDAVREVARDGTPGAEANLSPFFGPSGAKGWHRANRCPLRPRVGSSAAARSAGAASSCALGRALGPSCDIGPARGHSSRCDVEPELTAEGEGEPSEAVESEVRVPA